MKVGHKVWHEIGMHDEYLFWMAKHDLYVVRT